MSSCDVCNTSFSGKPAAKQHKQATGHCVCQHCSKVLASSGGLRAHEAAAHRHRCPKCPFTFSSKMNLANHQRSHNHAFCGDCNKTFGTVAGLNNHLQSSRHSTEFRCCDCDRDFKSAMALEQHVRYKVHRNRHLVTAAQKKSSKKKDTSNKTIVPPLHCSECSRNFGSPVALQQHIGSVKHNPICKLSCLGSVLCKAKFSSPSALFNHLESGGCSSGISRDDIKTLVQKYDKERLITWASADDAMLPEKSVDAGLDSYEPLLRTPSVASLDSSSELCLTPASERMFDWELLISETPSRRCPFSPIERRPFRNSKALQDHMKSVAHCEAIFHCPVTFSGDVESRPGMMKTFKTVGSLAQHLESGVCVGGTPKFWEALKYLEMRFKEFGLPFRLTN